ncbi:MAG: ATP-binding protein [Selenomonadaceae bacterium]|nr:ATP-binding protein [Selenomonadaceae bacterium]
MRDEINRLQDFCDMEALEHILKNWAQATNMGVILFGEDNGTLIGPHGFPAYCHLIYSGPAGRLGCKENAGKTDFNLSCHAGLNEFTIMVCLPDGRPLGKIICGQTKSPGAASPDFREMAERCGIPEQEAKLRAGYKAISYKSRKEMEASRELLSSIVETFIEKSYNKWLIHHEKSTDRTLSQLIQQLFGYNVTVNLANMQYELIAGIGMDPAVEQMKRFADYEELNRAMINALPAESRERVNSLVGIPALKKLAGVTGYIGRVVYNNPEPDGLHWYEAHLFMGFNENGNPIANILGRDVTAETEKMDTMAQLEAERAASAAKSRFLSNMSHDIRTPLNGIMGLLAIAKNHHDEKPVVDECLENINVASRHLLTLINDVLDLNKLESGKMVLAKESFNLLDVIREIGVIVKPLAVEAKVFLSMPEVDIIHPYVISSPLHIRQLVVNILTNAVKYNHPGGKVITVIRETHSDENTAYVDCTVTDDGIGMSEEFQQHMFNPFEQEHKQAKPKFQSTGLGLAIVKQIIDRLGGTIDVKSKENEGTCFRFMIPFTIDKNHKDEPRQESLSAPDVTGARVLLVEDNELNMEIATMLLEDAGAVVTTAADGEAAVEAFSNNPPGTFDIILMDIQMPVMDGLAATRTIRALPRPDGEAIPIYAMSANAFADDVIYAKEAGMNGHLAKPLDLPKILTTIAACMNRENNIG